MVVGLAEIGDKTQILSMMLAARFQRAAPVIFGILVATIANHAAAGLAGVFFGSLLTGALMRWILGISFLGSRDGRSSPTNMPATTGKSAIRGHSWRPSAPSFSPKSATQLATIGLAARFEVFYPVVIGTTLGMMLANIPAVLIGRRAADRLPLKAIRITAAAAFAALGAITLAGIGR